MAYAYYQSANLLKKKEVKAAIKFMMTHRIRGGLPYIEKRGFRGWICNLVPTKRRNGSYKYAQMDCSRFTRHRGIKVCKILVHVLWWRYINGGRKVPLDLDNCELSHLDSNPRYITTILESHDLNESRKYCHKFKWYRTLPGEERPRCPHREYPCTGPGLDFNTWFDNLPN